MKSRSELYFFLISFLTFGTTLFAQNSKEYFPEPKNGTTYVIAHRGVHIGIPENSLPAYEKAIDLGCDFVEIDVRRAKDGQIVSIHNSTIDKYVKGITGKVRDFTLEELKSLDIGERIGPEWKNTRIPTFEEILKLCQGKIGIYLDLKEPIVPELIEIIKEYKMERNIVWCIPASRMDAIKQVEKFCNSCIVMPDPGDEKNVLPVIEKIHPLVIAPVMDDFSETYVKTCHANGVKVFVDEDKGTEDEWDWILNLGTDGIQTDNPEELIKFIKKRSK